MKNNGKLNGKGKEITDFEIELLSIGDKRKEMIVSLTLVPDTRDRITFSSIPRDILAKFASFSIYDHAFVISGVGGLGYLFYSRIVGENDKVDSQMEQDVRTFLQENLAIKFKNNKLKIYKAGY